MVAQVSDAVAAQRLGGHSNIATTGLYLDADKIRALDAGHDASIALLGGTIGGDSNFVGPGKTSMISTTRD